MQEEREVITEFGAIKYTLHRKQVKNINLRIRADATVYVSAQPRVAVSRIEEFIISKAQFIVSAQQRFNSAGRKVETKLKYQSGEEIWILGQVYNLQVLESAKSQVVCEGNSLRLYITDADDWNKKDRLVRKYLRALCETEFTKLAQQAQLEFEEHGVAMPEIRLRDMKSRWGSCMPTRGIITLNTRLVEKPLHCIEYVVYHEFCHFIHPNHSRNFYDFLEKFIPDWRAKKAELNHKNGLL